MSSPGIGEHHEHDDAASLQQLGYKQEMSRSRGLFHILFMTLAIMAVPYGLGAPIATSLLDGGPVTMIYGLILVSFLSLMLALSIAEICSLYPTSAAAYYWCFRLSRPEYKVMASFINGWLTVVGNWTIGLSVTFGTAQLVVAGAGIFHPEWVATPWQTYVIFLGVTGVTSFFCLFLNSILPFVDILCACWTGLGTIINLICLSSKADAGRRPASFALGHFDASASGWTPGWAFFVGLLAPAYTFSAIGMVASMAEEVRNPAIQLPRAIALSVPIGAICGLVFLLPIVFTLPDPEILLQVPSGQSIGVMFTLIMGNKGGGFGLWFIIFGIGMFCAISICTAASRATWAFARDSALPYSKVFSKITNNYMIRDVPVNAFILSTTIQVLLGLIYLGSSAAFNAFVSVSVMCLGTSYAMPVAISLARGRKEVAHAPFSLGRFGFVINAVAVLWIAFAIVLFSMPTAVPPTKTNMNYASVVFVGFALISATWYLINGRYHYQGPPVPGNNSDMASPSPVEKDKSRTQGMY